MERVVAEVGIDIEEVSVSLGLAATAAASVINAWSVWPGVRSRTVRRCATTLPLKRPRRKPPGV
ncbi:hypothetical protein IQ62_44155 [Streptomyces scabiei]|nr:hypothetical protein IQ62_44155 [Streptomyces scabiei]